MKTYYLIVEGGKERGIFDVWKECEARVKGVRSKYKSYKILHEMLLDLAVYMDVTGPFRFMVDNTNLVFESYDSFLIHLESYWPEAVKNL